MLRHRRKAARRQTRDVYKAPVVFNIRRSIIDKILQMLYGDQKGKARVHEKGCIGCGHCYAICPQNAVSLSGYDCRQEPVVPMTALDSETLLAAMRSRRTIRQFTDQPVEKEKIRQILEAGRYSPTGGNSQSVTFTILGSRQKEAEEICVNLFRQGQKIGSKLTSALERFEISDSFFFKGAPLVIGYPAVKYQRIAPRKGLKVRTL